MIDLRRGVDVVEKAASADNPVRVIHLAPMDVDSPLAITFVQTHGHTVHRAAGEGKDAFIARAMSKLPFDTAALAL